MKKRTKVGGEFSPTANTVRIVSASDLRDLVRGGSVEAEATSPRWQPQMAAENTKRVTIELE